MSKKQTGGDSSRQRGAQAAHRARDDRGAASTGSRQGVRRRVGLRMVQRLLDGMGCLPRRVRRASAQVLEVAESFACLAACTLPGLLCVLWRSKAGWPGRSTKATRRPAVYFIAWYCVPCSCSHRQRERWQGKESCPRQAELKLCETKGQCAVLGLLLASSRRLACIDDGRQNKAEGTGHLISHSASRKLYPAAKSAMLRAD